MKQYIGEFFRRGLTACGFGPMILAAVYLILREETGVELLTVGAVCRGIVSLTALAVVAGGMNVLYQIERLPLMAAILIHGTVLYLGYLVTYLINGWLADGVMPVLIFSGIFVLGYLVIWGLIYSVTRKNTDSINEILLMQRQNPDKS